MSKNFHPFRDMLESAKEQHKVDKADFAAIKAESKAIFEEAKLSPKARAAKIQHDREAQIAAANARTQKAEDRIENAKRLNAEARK